MIGRNRFVSSKAISIKFRNFRGIIILLIDRSLNVCVCRVEHIIELIFVRDTVK